MSNNTKKLTYIQAKAIAEEAATEAVERFIDDTSINVLDEMFVEAEYCWFFFRNKLIKGPPEQVLRWDRAYAVSKLGELRLIADFSNDPNKLQEYLQVMSEHFRDKGL